MYDPTKSTKDYPQPIRVLDFEPMFLNQIFMDGVADGQLGNVESPYGHLYRVNQYLVNTFSTGMSITYQFADEAAAIEVWEYAEHLDSEES